MIGPLSPNEQLNANANIPAGQAGSPWSAAPASAPPKTFQIGGTSYINGGMNTAITPNSQPAATTDPAGTQGTPLLLGNGSTTQSDGQGNQVINPGANTTNYDQNGNPVSSTPTGQGNSQFSRLNAATGAGAIATTPQGGASTTAGSTGSTTGGTSTGGSGTNGQISGLINDETNGPLSPENVYAGLVSSNQNYINSTNASFAAQLQEQGVANNANSKAAEYAAAAGGMMGTPAGNSAIEGAANQNAAASQVIQTNQQQAIAQILANFNSNAISLSNAQASNDSTAVNQLTAQQASQQASFKQLAGSSNLSWSDFQAAYPQSAQDALASTGYDSGMAAMVWNSSKALAQQLDYSKIPPTQNADGTTTYYAQAPGSNQITSTTIDNAPAGYRTVMQGNMPYWQALNADGSPNPNGALYPQPNAKSNYITLKDAAGTNYLYDTYSGNIVNPLGADTSNASSVAQTGPATPLTSTSTVSQLLGYYTKGDPSYTPGAGYLGAVTNSLGLSGDTDISQISSAQIPALAQGIMQGEGGANGAAAGVHNQGEIEWATAHAYGLDTQFGATKWTSPNGTVYAAFPDDQTGTAALQSYLGDLINGTQSSSSSSSSSDFQGKQTTYQTNSDGTMTKITSADGQIIREDEVKPTDGTTPTTDIVSAMKSDLTAVQGQDGGISASDWNSALDQWLTAGYSLASFKSNFGYLPKNSAQNYVTSNGSQGSQLSAYQGM